MNSEKLKAILAVFPLPVMVFNRQGLLLAYNNNLCTLFGCKREQLPVFLQKQQLIPWLLARCTGADKEDCQRLEAQLVNDLGMKIYLNIRLYRSRCGQYNYAFVTDTAQEEKDEQLGYGQETLYRLITENAVERIAVIEPETMEIKYLNPTYLSTLGYTEDEVLGRCGLEFVHPEDRPICLQALWKGLREGEVSAVYRELKKDGDSVWVEITGRLFIGPGGKQQGLLVARDIHRSKLAEDALREQEERLGEIYSVMLDGVACINRDLSIEYLSPSCRHLPGYEEKLEGKTISLKSIHPQDQERVVKALQEVMANALPQTLEYRALHADGQYVWMEAMGRAICDEEGQCQRVVFGLRNIDARKQAEVEWQYWKETYRLMVENSFDGITILSPDDYSCVYANPAFLSALGYDYDEFVGHNNFRLVHPDDIAKANWVFQQGLQAGEGQMQYRMRKKDGSYITWEARGRYLRGNEKGEIVLFSRDITRQKEAREALRANEQRLRQITDNMSDAVAVIDEKGEAVYLSPSYANLLGWPLEDINPSNGAIFHPHDRQLVSEYISGLMNGLSLPGIEYRCQHARGYYIWVESLGKAIRNDQQEITGLVLGTRDITQRKTAEQQLQEQVEYHNTLIHHMNEFCYTYDLDCRVTFINQRMLDSLGYTVEEVLGKPIIDFVPHEYRELVLEMAARRIAREDPGRYEHELICKDGRVLLVRIKGSPLLNHGQVEGGLILAEDITDYREMEKQMARLAQLHTVGEIAAGIGHEIRNPMTTVKGFLQLMSREERFNDYHGYLDLMIEELERANDIISEFLSLARNKLVHLKTRQLNDIVRMIYPLLQADAAIGDHCILLELEEIPELKLDEKEIRQLLLNLVRNALEASPMGGQVTIQTRCDENGKILLAVSDQGPGIPSNIKDKLGTPFFTTKENGTGLGLAVCYGIIERHHASMDIVTGPTGTTIIVAFTVP